jgi:hypothetical protein
MQQASRGSGRGRDESHLYSSWSASWSAWEWNEQYQCESRYRQDRNGEWKWEHRQFIPQNGSALKPDVVQESSQQDQYGGPSSLESWSAWRWSDKYQCQERYRKNRNGEWEWEYSNVTLEDGRNVPRDSASVTVVQESSQQDEYSAPSFPEPNDDIFGNAPNANLSSNSADVSASFGNLRISEQSSSDRFQIICTWPSCSETFIRISDRDRHYQTIHANNGDRPYKCLVEGCSAGVKSWANAEKAKSHNKNWHGPYHCPVNGCPRAFPCGLRFKQDLDNHTLEVHSTNMLFSSADAGSMFGKAKEPENYSYSSPAPTFSSAVPRSNASYTPLQSSIPSNKPQRIRTRISTSTAEKSDMRKFSGLHFRAVANLMYRFQSPQV